jgi:WD40 repeat protein
LQHYCNTYREGGVTDIFLSYSRADRERVRPVRDALVAHGFEVFWDQEVPGGADWDVWIRERLANSKCAMVFWSSNSIASRNVRHEAMIADKEGKLITVLLEPLDAKQFPMGLYTQQATNLAGWTADLEHDEWYKLCRECETRLMPSWVKPQVAELESELKGQRARREEAQRRSTALEAQVVKKDKACQELERERDNALDDATARQATIEELNRALADAKAREVRVQQESHQRITRWAFGGVAAVIVVAAATVGYLHWDKDRQLASASADALLQNGLARLDYIDLQILRLQLDADARWERASQFWEDALGARQSNNLNRAFATERGFERAEEERNKILSNIATLAEDRDDIVRAISDGSARLYRKLDEQHRRQITLNVLERLRNLSLTPESKLRIALYSVAAIPENEEPLNEELRASIAKFRLRSLFKPPGSHQVWAVAFNPVDQKQAAVGDNLGVVWLWDPMDGPKGKPTKTFLAAGDFVNGLAFSPDGTKLAASYRKSGAVVWNLATNKELCPLGRRTRPGGEVSSSGANNYGVAFAPDGHTLAVAGERSLQLWDLDKEGCPLKSNPFLQEDEVFGVAFGSPSDLVAAAGGNGTVTVWELNQPDKLRKFFGSHKRAAMLAVGFDPTDSALMAASAADGHGFVWNIDTGAETELPPRGGVVGQIAFSPDGKWLVATATDKGEVIVLDPRGKDKPDQLVGGSKNAISGIAFSPDSKFLLIGDLGGAVRLWSVDAEQDIPGDRDTLIKLGAQHIAQHMADLNLTDDECKVLREMRIPLFMLADKNLEMEDHFCRIPYLGPRPDLVGR